MSYTPINWQNGDTITAEKMNKMDNGWSVGETQILSETVTTTIGDFPFANGSLAYAEQITDSSIIVVFDGTSYTVARNEYGYGEAGSSGPVFTNYPFFIISNNGNAIYTENAGTYTIAISAVATEVSEDFDSAVNKCIGSLLPFQCIAGSSTIQEMNEASHNGRLLYFYPYGSDGSTQTCVITYYDLNGVSFIPTNQSYSAQFDGNGIFTVIIN